MLSAGLIFSDARSKGEVSGMIAVCTGVMPPPRLPNPPAAPPQKPPVAARRGLVGRSLFVFGVMILFDEGVEGAAEAVLPLICENVWSGERGLSGAGGGSMGLARPSRIAFLRAATSCRRALFSDLVVPNSFRMALMSRSRSAISPSSVWMYSGNRRAC